METHMEDAMANDGGIPQLGRIELPDALAMQRLGGIVAQDLLAFLDSQKVCIEMGVCHAIGEGFISWDDERDGWRAQMRKAKGKAISPLRYEDDDKTPYLYETLTDALQAFREKWEEVRAGAL